MGCGISSCTCGNHATAVIPASSSRKGTAKSQQQEHQHQTPMSSMSIRTAKTIKTINGSIRWEDWRSDMEIIDYGDDSDSDNTLTEDDPEFEAEKNNLNQSYGDGNRWMITTHNYGGGRDGPGAVPVVEDPRRLSIDGRPLTRPSTARHNHRTAVSSPFLVDDSITADEHNVAATAAKFAAVNGVRRQVTRYHHNGGVSNYLSLGNNANGRYKQKRNSSAISKKSKDPEEEWQSLCDSAIPVDRTTSADRSRRSSLVPNPGTYVPLFSKNSSQSDYNKPNQRAPLPHNMADSGYSGSTGGSSSNFKTASKTSGYDYYESDCDSLMTEELGSDIIEDYSGSMNSLNTLTSGKGTSIDSSQAHMSPDPDITSFCQDGKCYRPKAAGRHRSAPRQYCLD